MTEQHKIEKFLKCHPSDINPFHQIQNDFSIQTNRCQPHSTDRETNRHTDNYNGLYNNHDKQTEKVKWVKS